jgi:hypothetical protein
MPVNSVNRLTNAMLFVAALTSILRSLSAQQAPVIDGLFSEWNDVHLVARDPVGDATGAFDLMDVHAQVFGSTIFLKFEIGETLNLQNGPEAEGTLVLKLRLPRQRDLEIDFRNRIALLRSGDTASTIPWVDLRFEALPTYAASAFECQIDLSDFGVNASDQIGINFLGSDELENDILLLMNSLSLPAYRSDIPIEKPSGRVRVASINTFNSGLSDRERAPVFRSMLELADADIYCFNEEWDDNLFFASLPEIFPEHLGKPLNSYKSGGCAIVSASPIRPIPMELGRSVAAAVDLPSGTVVVVSVHFKCCGYAGSPEDDKRMTEVKTLIDEITKMNTGDFGEDLKNVPVMVIGDYNLVGSRKPIDLLREQGFHDYLLRSPVDGSVCTWRAVDPSETFWPGRLDWVTYEKSKFTELSGFILNPSDMPLFRPGITSASPVSDHAMLVVDWEP